MKPDIHPVYRPVLFRDATTGKTFLSRSTMTSTQSEVWEDGRSYPLVTLEVTSDSHPYFTGQQRLLDTQGRVERFTRKYAAQRETAGSPPPAPARPTSGTRGTGA